MVLCSPIRIHYLFGPCFEILANTNSQSLDPLINYRLHDRSIILQSLLDKLETLHKEKFPSSGI